MSIEAEPRIRCAQPGCGETPPYADDGRHKLFGYASYVDYLIGEFDWQAMVNPDGTTTYYCPDHTHTKCHECGRSETFDIDGLAVEGWRNPGWYNAVCPDCLNAMLEKMTTR